MSAPGPGALAVDEGDHFLCTPPCLHRHVQTISRPRLLYAGSGMVLHFPGSVALEGHKSLLAEITFKHNKTPCAKPSMSQAGNSPWQSCLPFALPPGFLCLRCSPAEEECGVFAFTVDLSCSTFLKDFSSLTDIR